jgi:succinate dehydrogenase / fumarate reductase, cytochrome b subunit
MKQALTFIDTTLGKKVVMAISGLVLFGFVLGHMAGNLQIFLGAEAFNSYAIGMHEKLGPLLWVARAVLLVAVIAHIVMAVQLVTRASAARPIGYRVKKNETTTFAALTMKFSGLTLLFFVLFHIAHFTFPGVAMSAAYEHQGYSMAYSNFVNGFSIPWVVALYIAAMISLGLHLYHGSFSLFQTLGINNPLRNGTIKAGAQFVALIITVGNIILPLSVLLGLVQ